MKQLFLIGYEKESLTHFVNKLEKNKIKIVFDVRKIPISQKNSFSKNMIKKFEFVNNFFHSEIIFIMKKFYL